MLSHMQFTSHFDFSISSPPDFGSPLIFALTLLDVETLSPEAELRSSESDDASVQSALSSLRP